MNKATMIARVTGLVATLGTLALFAKEGDTREVAIKLTELPQRHSDVAADGLAFSPSGDELAVEAEPGTIDIWNVKTGHLRTTLHEAEGAKEVNAVQPISYSPNGRFLAACHWKAVGDVVIRVWGTKDWQVVKDLTGEGCSGMAFSNDGSLLFRAAQGVKGSNELVVTNMSTWEETWSLPLVFSPLRLAVNPTRLIVAVNGMTTSSVGEPGTINFRTVHESPIEVVDVQAQSVVSKFYDAGSMAWSPDGARLVVAGARGVSIYDPYSGKQLSHDDLRDGASHMDVSFTPDGRYLIESDMNGQGTGLGIHIWDGDREHLIQKISGNPSSIAVSKDSKLLAVGEAGRSVIWQLH